MNKGEAALVANERQSRRSIFVVEVRRHVLFRSNGAGHHGVGIEPQLKEIENGLLDLLANRPRAAYESLVAWGPTLRGAENARVRWRGRVTQVVGQLVESEGPFCSVGECCEMRWQGVVSRRDRWISRPDRLLDALDQPEGIRYGDRIVTWGRPAIAHVGGDCWAA